MASRMNSGGSIDLNSIKIDPRTGEKFSFNLDISNGHGVVWPGSELRIEPQWGEKFSFNVDIPVVAAMHFHSYFATDFDENSMASRMNSSGSIDLNLIEIDPRTSEKFSFNLDKVAATAWYGQEASRF